MLGYLVATRISSWCSSLSLADSGPQTHILHFPKPKSNTSYNFLSSSKIVSLPTIPMSAAPYSTYVGTSLALARKNFNFNSSLTKISLRVFSSFISSHWIPICSNISIAVFAKRPFARAKVKYLILLTYNSTAPSFETYVILVAPSSFLNVVYSSNDIFSFLEINSVLTP